jgi:hypothetical protein
MVVGPIAFGYSEPDHAATNLQRAGNNRLADQRLLCTLLETRCSMMLHCAVRYVAVLSPNNQGRTDSSGIGDRTGGDKHQPGSLIFIIRHLDGQPHSQQHAATGHNVYGRVFRFLCGLDLAGEIDLKTERISERLWWMLVNGKAGG